MHHHDARLIPKRHRLRPDPLLQPGGPKPSIATALRATMRQRRLIVHRHPIDMHGATLNAPRKPQSTAQILRKHRRRQAILSIIREPQGLLLGLNLDDRHRGPERLRAVHIHRSSHALDHHRRHMRPRRLVVLLVAANQHLRSLGQRVLDQSHITLHTRLIHQHTRRPKHQRDLLSELLLERPRHALVHQDLLRAHAHLPTMHKRALGALRRRKLQIRILPDNGGGLAAQLQQHRLQIPPGSLGNDAADQS